MRKVTYGVGCSLDGFIARSDETVDWLQWSKDVERISSAFWRTLDTVLMGRRTYEVAVAAGTRSYPGVRSLVFSRTLRPEDFPEVEIHAGDAVEHVEQLKNSAGRGVAVMGGGRLASSLLNKGLIDEIGVNVHPILLGSGIPFLSGLRREIALELKHTESLSHGCIYLLYAVR